MCHKTKKAMNTDTVELLRECEAGSKMATNSMEQMMSYIGNEDLRKLLEGKNNDHIKLGEECHHILCEVGVEDKDPDPMASFWAKAQTGVKMTLNGDTHQAAKLLMDGCRMGIQSISEYMNTYTSADHRALAIAEKLRNIEKDLLEELEAYV